VLGSAADDGPAPASRSRAAKRLGIASIVLASGTEATVAATTALWWKAGLVIALIGGAVAIAIVTRSPAADDAPPPPPPAPIVVVDKPVVKPAPPAPPPIEQPADQPEPAPVDKPADKPIAIDKPVRKRVESPPPSPPVEPTPAPVEESPPPPPPAPPAPVQVDARRLAAEVAVLDRARTALARRDATTALAALDEHRRDFADGALVAEAEVVRLEVLVETNQVAAARAQAADFLAKFPRSPLVRRVRSLVERIKETP
jgi:outer membrane biosynthesis protein TonB